VLSLIYKENCNFCKKNRKKVYFSERENAMVKLWCGFAERQAVEYEKDGRKHLATVAEYYDHPVKPGCVPVVLIPEGCVLDVPADALTLVKK
jgi:hypothetical protein